MYCLFLIVMISLMWFYYVIHNKLKKYFICSLISIVSYWFIIVLTVVIEGKIRAPVFMFLSAILYIIALILCFKRGSHFVLVMEKYYPAVMYKYNMSRNYDKKFKNFSKELEKIKKDNCSIVNEAMLQRDLITTTFMLHAEIIVVTACTLMDNKKF